MSESHLLFDALTDQNRLVLQAYADRSQAAKAASDEHDGWLDRLLTVAGVDADAMTTIHGELIALGMLKFELTNRQVGLRYRVSTRGAATLERPATPEEEHVTEPVDSSEGAQEAPVSHLSMAAVAESHLAAGLNLSVSSWVAEAA